MDIEYDAEFQEPDLFSTFLINERLRPFEQRRDAFERLLELSNSVAGGICVSPWDCLRDARRPRGVSFMGRSLINVN